MKKIRYAIIGLGNQGMHYSKNLFEKGLIDNGEIVALCDINPEKNQSAKSRLLNKNIVYFENYLQMLDSGLCDAAIITVPHYQHPEMVTECLKREISVLCDKPAGVYTKQVREMNEFAKSRTGKAKFTMMFNQRTNCLYRKMREIISAGGIGELQRMVWIITDWFRTQYYYDSNNWRATWDGEGGGVLINQCPHQLDLVQWVLGQSPKKVTGFCHYGKWHDIEVEDDVTAYFEYENGATGVFITTTGEAPGTNRFEVSGTKGKLVCENNELKWYKNKSDSRLHCSEVKVSFAKPEMELITVETDGENLQHKGIINNFTNHLLGLEDLFIDGIEGIKGVELMNAIELSGWLGRREITLPVDEDLYLKELNKKRAESRIKAVADTAAESTADSFGTLKAVNSQAL